MTHRTRFLSTASTSGWIGLVLGCGAAGPTAAPTDARETAVALKLLGIQYGESMGLNGGAAPRDAGAFRKFLDARVADLANYGVKSADDLLTSRRDNQPLAILYGKRIEDPDQPGMIWSAHEQTGVDGKRLASNVRGAVVELSAEEFARRLPGAN